MGINYSFKESLPLRNKVGKSFVLFGTVLALVGFTQVTSEKDTRIEDINKLIINADLGKHTINKNIYGHFAEHLGRCIYEGIWVGEDSPIPNTRGIRNDVVGALRKIKVPVLRWPGGCYADAYHWMDGIGPKDKRPTTVNVMWGGVSENNHFGTHELLDLCEQLGAEPLINGNIGSGTVKEFSQWVEYVTFDGISQMADLRRANGRNEPWKVKYWQIGNENWNCGGNMSPEYYNSQFRQFATYIHNYSDNQVYRIACGPYGNDYEWMEVLMEDQSTRSLMNGVDMHQYTSIRPSYLHAGHLRTSATQFGEEEWFTIFKLASTIDEILTNHGTIMDKYDPEKRIALIIGEWGTWHDVEPGTKRQFLYMQNSLRDALMAGITLNIFNQHCDRVQMACIAQMVNVLQAMILTEGEKMILTPTYHIFEMFKVHQNATLLPTDLQSKAYRFGEEEIPGLSVSASKDESGKIHITIVNTDPNNIAKLDCELHGIKANKVAGQVLTAPAINSHNTFDNPEVVRPVAFKDVKLTRDGLIATLPAKSVILLEIE